VSVGEHDATEISNPACEAARPRSARGVRARPRGRRRRL